VSRGLAALAAVGLLTGCATADRPRDYDAFFTRHPRSIVVVPPMNRTTAVDAPAVFSTTITRPLAERGYYVFPVALTTGVLRDLGITDEGLVRNTPPQRFKEVFGADAVLYVTINSWTTTYIVLSSQVTVNATYELVDTATGTTLWKRTQQVAQGSRGNNLIEMLVSAAITAATVDYRPLAQQANAVVVYKQAEGLPSGPYHSTFQQDYDSYR
jgi:hypothetical protein